MAIVIDALDDCSDPSMFFECLSNIGKSESVKVVVLSRPEVVFKSRKEKIEEIRFGTNDTRHDMAIFNESQMATSSSLSKPFVQARIQERFGMDLPQLLLARSAGSFLWLSLVFRDLKTNYTGSDIVRTLETLPTGIKAYYASNLARLVRGHDQSTVKIIKILLQWLACVTRPLNIDEVWEILSFKCTKSASNTINEDEFLLDKDKIAELCGSLVIQENMTLYLVHLSLAQFLRTAPLEGESDSTEFIRRGCARAQHGLRAGLCRLYELLLSESRYTDK